MTTPAPSRYRKTCLPVDEWLAGRLAESGITGSERESLVEAARERFIESYQDVLDDLLVQVRAASSVPGTGVRSAAPLPDAVETAGTTGRGTSRKSGRVSAPGALPPIPEEHESAEVPDDTPVKPLVVGESAREDRQRGNAARNAGSSGPAVHDYPWYVDHGALGDAEVVHVPDWSVQRAELWAAVVASHVADVDVRRAVLSAVRQILAYRDRAEWSDALANGLTAVAGDHLVWVRPLLAGVRGPAAGGVVTGGSGVGGTLRDTAEPERLLPEGEREFRVGTQSTSVSGSETVTSTASTWVQTVVNLGLLGLSHASTAPVTVQVGMANSTTDGWSTGRTVKAGYRSQPAWESFSSGRSDIRFRVFVDGHELASEVLVERQLGISFPPALPAGAVRVGSVADGAEDGQRPAPQRPARSPMFLNALDTAPVIAGLHGQLLRDGLPAVAVRDVMVQLQPWLDERELRQHAPWVLSSGLPTGPIEVSVPGRFPGSRRTFRASFTIRAGIESLQFLGLSQPGLMRGLGGITASTSSLHDGTSRADVNAGPLITGLVDAVIPPDTTGLRRTGRIPDIRAVGYATRSAGYTLSSSAVRQNEFRSRSPQVTYVAGLGMTVSATSPHRRIGEVNRTVQAELGTMWRGRPQAADFEQRVLGAVHTPAFRSPVTPEEAERPPLRPGPVENQPHVRALLRESGVKLERNHERPARLILSPRTPHPREPLALASRKGGGYSITLALPGAELVQDQFLAALKDDAGRRGDRVADWTTVERELSSVFGRPAMEQNAGRVMAGYRRTVWVGKRPYRLFVRGHLADRLPGDVSTGLDVESVVGAGGGVSGHRGTRWGVRGTLGGGGVLKEPGEFVFQLGSFGGFLECSRGVDTSFAGSSRSSRRSKPSTGADEHTYDIVYEQRLTPLKARRDKKEVLRKPKPDGPTGTWWVDRPGDVVAHIAVPHAYAPRTPVTAAEARIAGVAKRQVSWPADWGRHLDFAHSGTSGVVPAFLPAPELARMAARLYAKLNNLPKEWSRNPEYWPDEIHELADPDILASRFNGMVGRFGHEGVLMRRKGHQQGFRLRLRMYAPKDLGPLQRPVDIVDLKEAGSARESLTGTSFEAGVSGIVGVYPLAAGPQPGDAALAGGPVQGELSAVGGGHLYAQGRAWASRGWSDTRREEPGQITKNKATYKTPPHEVEAIPVFEFTALRWTGGGQPQEETGYLSVTNGVQLHVPSRVLQDLMPATAPQLTATAPPVDPGVPGRTAERTQPAGSPSHDETHGKTSVQVPLSPPPLPSRDYLTSDIAQGIGRGERLHADQVMDTITRLLRAHGVGPAGSRSDSPRPDLLNRTLHQLFSSEALENHLPLLMGTGVWAWVPVPGFLGSTSYIWVRVAAEEVEPAHEHRSRPDVRLNVATAATMNTRREDGSFGSWGVDVQAQAGAFHSSGRDGVEANAGYRRTTGRTVAQAESRSRIYDADARDTVEEFTHRLGFRIEVGGTTELPRVLDLPVTGVHGAVLGVAHHGFDSRERVARALDEHRAWTWHETARASGEVRLLVPSHLTGPVGERPLRPVSRVYGDEPRWAGRSSAPERLPELPEELLHRLHPLSIPAAAAVERWAALAASPAKRRPDLRTAEVWKVRGIDFTTTAGPSYAHSTSTGMLKANVARLLGHSYDVMVGGSRVTVGFGLDHAVLVGPPQGAEFYAARYTKEESDTTYSESETSGWYANAGPLTVGEGAGPTTVYANALAGGGVAQSFGSAYRDSNNDENSATGKVSRFNRYYRFDLTLTFKGPQHTLEVKAPGGLFGMLPLGSDGGLLGGLEVSLPHLFGPPQVDSPQAQEALRTPAPEGVAQAQEALRTPAPEEVAQAVGQQAGSHTRQVPDGPAGVVLRAFLDEPASGRSPGAVSVQPRTDADAGPEVESLLAGLNEEVRPAVRVWDGPAAERLDTLWGILSEPGARSLVFGAPGEEPVWAINLGQGNRKWFTLGGSPLTTSEFTGGPLASIDIDAHGQLTGPAMEALKLGGAAARNSAKTGFCDLNWGTDLSAVVGWRGAMA